MVMGCDVAACQGGAQYTAQGLFWLGTMTHCSELNSSLPLQDKRTVLEDVPIGPGLLSRCCHAGTALDSLARLFSMLRDLTEDGVRIFGAVGGDLTGWLGDLAPAYGDLDSIHLLYRMCCLYGCSATPTTDPALHHLKGHQTYGATFSSHSWQWPTR
jgi:hypothetical protein